MHHACQRQAYDVPSIALNPAKIIIIYEKKIPKWKGKEGIILIEVKVKWMQVKGKLNGNERESYIT